MAEPPSPRTPAGRRDGAWAEWLALARTFAEREGHALVPARHREDGRHLGSWVSTQRRRRSSLSPDRQRLLESLPGWSWRAVPTWEDWVGLLKAYAKREGHARVPESHWEQGRGLGIWVARQRQLRRLGQLDDCRRRQLEAVPGWMWRVEADAPTTEGWLELLDAYVAREGHARVERGHIEAGWPLGVWVARQRNRYQQGRLTAPLTQRLGVLPGWTWRTEPPDRSWDDWLALLGAYVAREGHALVPRAHVEDGAALGGWVATQRVHHKKGTLKEDRRRRLEAVPGWAWRARPVGPSASRGSGPIRSTAIPPGYATMVPITGAKEH